MKYPRRTIKLIIALVAATLMAQVSAAQVAPPQALSPEAAREQQFLKSMQYMLRRAQLTRTLAAEHLIYIKSQPDRDENRVIDDASQVMAFQLICDDETIDTAALNQIAADVSFKVAMMSGKSTIGQKLARIAKKQTVEDRMELIGDISTTVLMYEVGRRRGLFDALLTDFGKKRFCSGMQTDMRTRYKDYITALGE
jgi:hypothetical protein